MIHVHGYLGEIGPRTRELAAHCDLVVGGRRHLDALGVPEQRRVVLGAITPALARLAELPADGEALVIASGDPGFHGVLRRLRQEKALAGHEFDVRPAVTSAAAAFTAVALPWDDAVVVSAHGRPLDEAIAAARIHTKVAVLTSPQNTGRELAAALKDLDRTYVLAERLGEETERVRVLTTDEMLAVEEIREPNVVLILDGTPDSPELIARAGNASDASPDPASAPQNSEGSDDAPVIGQLVNSPAARRRASEIERIVGPTRVYDGPAGQTLPTAWTECDLIVSHLALGGTTRLIAPLLHDKKTDPGVVVVEDRKSVV